MAAVGERHPEGDLLVLPDPERSFVKFLLPETDLVIRRKVLESIHCGQFGRKS